MEIATKFAFAGSGGGQPSILVQKYTQSGQAVAGYQAREGRREDTDLQEDQGGNINTTYSIVPTTRYVWMDILITQLSIFTSRYQRYRLSSSL